MEKQMRLRSNKEFNLVYRRGKKSWNRNYTIIVKRNGTENTRVGFSISKKVGNAVTRNRIKRRLREIVRNHKDILTKGYDVVVIPKVNTNEMDYAQLEKSLLHVIRLAFKAK